MKVREKIILAGVIIMAFALLPYLSIAGSLEPPDNAVDPSGNPVPTMKTLDEALPTWSQKLQCDTTACPRFEIVMDGAAVLDKETGIVWQRSPGGGTVSWYGAQWGCWGSIAGARRGWRLPTIQELESVMDYSNPSWENCWGYLPCGHPFLNLQQDGVGYWSSTTWFFDSNKALAFYSSAIGAGTISWDKTAENHIWCVRSGYGINMNE